MVDGMVYGAIGVVLVGATILLKGLKGRRVGDHPICARCGYDLFGKPEESKVCPECGADLCEKKAVVIGWRQKRAGMVLVGLLIVGLGLIGVEQGSVLEG